MMYLVSYDISVDKIRNKVAKQLLKLGMERIQFSVFVGKLSETELEKLAENYENLTLNLGGHSIILIPLHQDMIDKILEMGSEHLDWDYLKGEKTIMIV